MGPTETQWCSRTWLESEDSGECMCDLKIGHVGPHVCCCGVQHELDGADDDR